MFLKKTYIPEEKINFESALYLFFLLSFSSTAEAGKHTNFTSVWSSGLFYSSPPSLQDKHKLYKTHSCCRAKGVQPSQHCFAFSLSHLTLFHVNT